MKNEDAASFQYKIRPTRCGFAANSHGDVIRDYLRHANLHVTNKYLQATTTSKRLAQGKLVDAILPGGVLSASKSTLVH